MIEVLAVLAITTTQSPAAQPEVIRRVESVAVAYPDYPRELAPAVDEYMKCFNAAVAGKPLIPTPEEAFEQSIQGCAEERAQSEQLAQQLKVVEWPEPGSPERALEVTKLLDQVAESHRAAGKAIAAQIAEITQQRPASEAPDP